MQRTEFSNPEVQRMYTLPGGKNVNVHDVTDIEVYDWDEKNHHRAGGKPCVIVRWQGRGNGGSHHTSFRDYETALRTYNETVEAVTRLRCLGVQPGDSVPNYDPRLHALALYLDIHPANVRKVEDLLYRGTLEPDEQGGPPRQTDYYVMTMYEAQKHWHTSDDYTVIDASDASIGPYYIFRA